MAQVDTDKLNEIIERDMERLLSTGYNPTKPTMLRLVGDSLVVEEIDLSPTRCTCPKSAIIHRPDCPAWPVS